MTCLPDFLWTDPRALYLKKRRRRLWMLLVDMERLRNQWHPDDVATWPDCVWAANLDVTERRFALDVAELRALGLIDAERIALTPCREPEPVQTAAPRPSYPSDKNRSRGLRADSATDSASTPQTLRADSATDSATDSARTPPHVYAPEGLSLSQAQLSQALNAIALEPKPGLAEPGRANGKYKHRREPNSQEMQQLLTRHKRADILEAIGRVQCREKFEGAGNWLRYLAPVLADIEAEKQQTLPSAGILSTVAGGDSKPSASTPQATPPPLPRREPPRFEKPADGFASLKQCLSRLHEARG